MLRPIPESNFAKILHLRFGKQIILPYTPRYSTATAPLDSTSIPQENADGHEGAPGGTGREGDTRSATGWAFGRRKPTWLISATNKNRMEYFSWQGPTMTIYCNWTRCSPSWGKTHTRLLLVMPLCYRIIIPCIPIIILEHKYAHKKPYCNSLCRQTWRFQRYPRGTKSRGGGKCIQREVKAGHCSRLDLLTIFIRIHCTFHFQMFGGFL